MPGQVVLLGFVDVQQYVSFGRAVATHRRQAWVEFAFDLVFVHDLNLDHQQAVGRYFGSLAHGSCLPSALWFVKNLGWDHSFGRLLFFAQSSARLQKKASAYCGHHLVVLWIVLADS